MSGMADIPGGLFIASHPDAGGRITQYEFYKKQCPKTISFQIVLFYSDHYYRGIFSIYEFDNANPIEIRKRRKARKAEKKKVSGSPSSAFFIILV